MRGVLFFPPLCCFPHSAPVQVPDPDRAGPKLEDILVRFLRAPHEGNKQVNFEVPPFWWKFKLPFLMSLTLGLLGYILDFSNPVPTT